MSTSIVEHIPWLKQHPPRSAAQRHAYQPLKRTIDLTLVTLSSPIWAPLAGVIALAIKLEDPKGDVLFRQYRTGTSNKRYAIYKFRSMVHNAEELKQTLAHLNEREPPDFKITNDPRITKVGKFIRATSLDEIPQLFNVLQGSLALVGPRPITLKYDAMQPWHLERFHTTAGLTGLWQVCGRDNPDYNDRVRMDIAYLDRQSLLLDLTLIIKTVFCVLKKEGK